MPKTYGYFKKIISFYVMLLLGEWIVSLNSQENISSWQFVLSQIEPIFRQTKTWLPNHPREQLTSILNFKGKWHLHSSCELDLSKIIIATSNVISIFSIYSLTTCLKMWLIFKKLKIFPFVENLLEVSKISRISIASIRCTWRLYQPICLSYRSY